MPGGSLLLLSEGAGMTAKKKTVIGYVLASLAIIAADQALKAWVVRNIPLNA